MKKLYLGRRYDEMKRTWILEMKSSDGFKNKRREALFLIRFIRSRDVRCEHYQARKQYKIIGANITRDRIYIEVMGDDVYPLQSALRRRFISFQRELKAEGYCSRDYDRVFRFNFPPY